MVEIITYTSGAGATADSGEARFGNGIHFLILGIAGSPWQSGLGNIAGGHRCLAVRRCCEQGRVIAHVGHREVVSSGRAVVDEDVIGIQPDVLKRHLEATVTLNLDGLCPALGKVELIGHEARIVAQRCSHTARDERVVTVVGVPGRAVKGGAVAQTALVEAVLGQRGVVGSLAVHRGVFDTEHPLDGVVGPACSNVGAVLTISPH